MAGNGRLLATADGGRTWRTVSVPQPHDWAIFAGVTGPRQGWDLVNHCEGTSTGRYLGPYLLTSADAGRTWWEFPWDNAFWCTPQSLSFATAADGWLLMRGNSHLYRTTDGGASWHQLL